MGSREHTPDATAPRLPALQVAQLGQASSVPAARPTGPTHDSCGDRLRLTGSQGGKKNVAQRGSKEKRNHAERQEHQGHVSRLVTPGHKAHTSRRDKPRQDGPQGYGVSTTDMERRGTSRLEGLA